MRSFGNLWPFVILAVGGGCITQLDEHGSVGMTGESTSASSSTGSGGMSGSGGSGGAGGGGTCADVICDKRPDGCPSADCSVLLWAQRVGSAEAQAAHGVAVNPLGQIAIAGTYRNGGFSFGQPAQVSVPDAAPSGTFTEGFVTLYDAKGGALWAKPLGIPDGSSQSHREARSVAFDGLGALVVAGFESSDAMPNNRHVFIQSVDVMNPLVIWTRTSLLGESTYTEAIAVTSDQTDIYIVGRANGSPGMFPCGATTAQIEAGMFVTKYDASDGSCLWHRSINSAVIDGSMPTAIIARDAATNGVWLTGTFSTTLDLSPLSALVPPGGLSPFLIRLNAATGEPTAAYQFKTNGGEIVPTAIDLTSKGVPVLVGRVTGSTEFSPSLAMGQNGAFAAIVEPINESTAKLASSFVMAGAPKVGENAAATGVFAAGNQLYVSGTFSTEMTLPANAGTVTRASNVPFLALFDSSDLTLRSFDAFEVPGTPEPNSSQFVHLAGYAQTLVITGGWLHDLDLSTQDKQANGLLPALFNTTTSDVFIAKFNLVP